MFSIAYVSLLDVPFVQETLMSAYDLLEACESADDVLITDESKAAAADFRQRLNRIAE